MKSLRALCAAAAIRDPSVQALPWPTPWIRPLYAYGQGGFGACLGMKTHVCAAAGAPGAQHLLGASPCFPASPAPADACLDLTLPGARNCLAVLSQRFGALGLELAACLSHWGVIFHGTLDGW